MRAGQVAGGHQKFVDDFPAGKPEGSLKDFDPFLFGFGMVVVDPFFERTELFLQLQDGLCIGDSSLDLEAVSDDAGVIHQAVKIFFRKGGHFPDGELFIGLPEIFLLVKDGGPAEPCLVDFQYQSFEELIVVFNRKSIGRIMIDSVDTVFVHPFYYITIGSWLIHRHLIKILK